MSLLTTGMANIADEITYTLCFEMDSPIISKLQEGIILTNCKYEFHITRYLDFPKLIENVANENLDMRSV